MRKFIFIVLLLMTIILNKVLSQTNYVGIGYRSLAPITSISNYFKKTSLNDVNINQGYFPYFLFFHTNKYANLTFKTGYVFFDQLEKIKVYNGNNIILSYKHHAFPFIIGAQKRLIKSEILDIGLMFDLGLYIFSEKYSESTGNSTNSNKQYIGYNCGISFASRKIRLFDRITFFISYQQIYNYKFKTFTIDIPFIKL